MNLHCRGGGISPTVPVSASGTAETSRKKKKGNAALMKISSYESKRRENCKRSIPGGVSGRQEGGYRQREGGKCLRKNRKQPENFPYSRVNQFKEIKKKFDLDLKRMT